MAPCQETRSRWTFRMLHLQVSSRGFNGRQKKILLKMYVFVKKSLIVIWGVNQHNVGLLQSERGCLCCICILCIVCKKSPHQSWDCAFVRRWQMRARWKENSSASPRVKQCVKVLMDDGAMDSGSLFTSLPRHVKRAGLSLDSLRGRVALLRPLVARLCHQGHNEWFDLEKLPSCSSPSSAVIPVVRRRYRPFRAHEQ